MSFTDGKPFVATEEHCALRWACRKPGEHFRCFMCGHRFKPGDTVRWQYTNDLTGGRYYGNPFVCAACDGPDVIERWKKHCDEAYSDRFWWFTEDRG